MDNPKVSFVVPCYNYGRYLGDCLASIFAQEEAPDFEIIAIDDASTDDTQDVLARFAGPRLRVRRHTSNQGHVVTINEGFALASAPFVARIDPDDRYRPLFLKETLAIFARYPEVGMVYGDASIIGPDGHQTKASCDDVHKGRDFKGNEYVALLERNFVCAPTVIARKEAWKAALPIPSGLSFSDWYLSLRMAMKFDFYYIHRVLADYRVHPQNLHNLISRNGTEEESIMRILAECFQNTEKDPALEIRKQGARSRIYAAHFKMLGDKYFGFGRMPDARRCYLEAIRREPTQLLDAGLLRRLSAALIRYSLYNRMKLLVKK